MLAESNDIFNGRPRPRGVGGPRVSGYVPLRDGIQTQPVQAGRDPAFEHVGFVTKTRGFLHFSDRTLNEAARPIRATIGRSRDQWLIACPKVDGIRWELLVEGGVL